LIYNSYLSCGFLFFAVYFSGEYNYLSKFDNYSFSFYLMIAFSMLLTIVLNFSYLKSNEQNSSLFTQLLSNCKDIFITTIAMFTLNDFKANFTTISGIMLSTSGALLFSIKSIIENMRKN